VSETDSLQQTEVIVQSNDKISTEQSV